MVYCFCIYPPSWDVSCPRTLLSTKGLDMLQWTPFISDLHIEIRIISRSVPCRLSNWFSLRCLIPWMNHLPPVWWFMLSNESWYLCKFSMLQSNFVCLFMVLYITQVLSRFLKWFYCIKYSVLSYPIDVISTVSSLCSHDVNTLWTSTFICNFWHCSVSRLVSEPLLPSALIQTR